MPINHGKRRTAKLDKNRRNILENNSQNYKCPHNESHYLSLELNVFSEYNKKELVLICKSCNKRHILSATLI